MIKNQHLLHAKTALELGSFKKAAGVHHLSEPAFSRSIASLEESLGVKLFSRSPSGVVATAFGELLYKYSEKVLDTVAELEREIRLLKGLGTGELSLALGPYPAEISCHTALAYLLAAHSEIRCKVAVADWLTVNKLVVSHDVDLGIAEIIVDANSRSLAVEPLPRHKIVLYCRSDHPLLKKKNFHKADLKEYPFAGIRLPGRMSTIFPGRIFPVEYTDHVVPSIELQYAVLAKELVLKSDTISGAAICQIEHELEKGLLTVIPWFEPLMTFNYGILFMKDRTLSPVAETYISFLKEVELEVAERNEALLRKYCPRL